MTKISENMRKGYYTQKQLLSMNFAHLGTNVLISKKASIYLPEKISIGSNVRIDDFCLLVGNIYIGNYVHIAAFTGLHASIGSIFIDDYSTLSSQVTIYSASDDYSGKSMTNSIIPEEFKNVISDEIKIGRHVIVGTGSTIIPNSIIPDGVAIGAMSLVNRQLDPWIIYAGIPCHKIRDRDKNILNIEREFLSKEIQK